MQCSRSSRLVRAVLFVAASAVTLVTLATASSAHAGFKAYSASVVRSSEHAACDKSHTIAGRCSSARRRGSRT
jgi:hypothetical protein